KTHRVYIVPGPNPAPAHPVPIVSASPADPAAQARRVEEILINAARRVSSGDVAGAREMLTAEEWYGAQGPIKFAFGETYDPTVLAAWGSRGAISDVVRAKALYRKALERGVTRAQTRLEALDSPSSALIVKSGITISVTSPLRAEPAAGVRLPIEI